MKVPSRCAQLGFSMIELLIVAGLVGVVAAFAIPQIQGSMTAYRLKASANIIAEELDAARVMAISRGAIYEVRFSSRAVSVIDVEDGNSAARLPKNLETGVSLTNAPAGGIRFFPRGYAQAANLTLANEYGSTIQVRVLLSGKIKVEDMAE